MKKNPATDLLDALRASIAPSDVPPGYYTLSDLCEQTGFSRAGMQAKLKRLGAEEKSFRIRTSGRMASVKHYRLAG